MVQHPARTFADVGGLDDQKRRIGAVVQNRLHPERFKQHGVVQNAFSCMGLLAGQDLLPRRRRASSQSLLVAKPTSLVERWIGAVRQTSGIRLLGLTHQAGVVFSWTMIDSIGTQRQQLWPK